jgi:hypothetical protein
VVKELDSLRQFPLQSVLEHVTVTRSNGQIETDWKVGFNILQRPDDSFCIEVWKDRLVKCVDLIHFRQQNPMVVLSFVPVPHRTLPPQLLF